MVASSPWLTQEEAADALYWPRTRVCKCEIGKRRGDFVELEELAEDCGKAQDWFATKGRR